MRVRCPTKPSRRKASAARKPAKDAPTMTMRSGDMVSLIGPAMGLLALRAFIGTMRSDVIVSLIGPAMSPLPQVCLHRPHRPDLSGWPGPDRLGPRVSRPHAALRWGPVILQRLAIV